MFDTQTFVYFTPKLCGDCHDVTQKSIRFNNFKLILLEEKFIELNFDS